VNARHLTGAAIAVAVGLATHVHTQPSQAPADISSLHVQGNVWLLVGAGGNVAVQTGDEGVLVVDTGLAQNADKLLAAIKKLSDKPIAGSSTRTSIRITPAATRRSRRQALGQTDSRRKSCRTKTC